MKEMPKGQNGEHRRKQTKEHHGLKRDRKTLAETLHDPQISVSNISGAEGIKKEVQSRDLNVGQTDIVTFASSTVDDVPKQYEKVDIYRAVRMLHDARETIREEDISLIGVVSKAKAKKVEANTILQVELDARPDLVDLQLEPYMPYLQGKGKKKETPEVVKEKVVKNYRDGLGTVINLLSKTSEDDFDLHSAIIGYTASFKNMLQVCEQYDLHPNTAVFLARQSYAVTGPDLRQLFDKYEHIPQKIVLHAAKFNPRNPVRFVKGFIDTVDQLSADDRYVDVSPGVIARAAENNSNDPEGYLDQYIITRDRLRKDPQFASLQPHVIEFAAAGHPGNPEKYLADYTKAAERIAANEKYNDIPSRVIVQALRSSLQDPEGFLDEYTVAIEGLRSDVRFKGLSPTVLIEAAATTDPESFLARHQKTIARLSAKSKISRSKP